MRSINKCYKNDVILYFFLHVPLNSFFLTGKIYTRTMIAGRKPRVAAQSFTHSLSFILIFHLNFLFYFIFFLFLIFFSLLLIKLLLVIIMSRQSSASQRNFTSHTLYDLIKIIEPFKNREKKKKYSVLRLHLIN